MPDNNPPESGRPLNELLAKSGLQEETVKLITARAYTITDPLRRMEIIQAVISSDFLQLIKTPDQIDRLFAALAEAESAGRAGCFLKGVSQNISLPIYRKEDGLNAAVEDALFLCRNFDEENLGGLYQSDLNRLAEKSKNRKEFRAFIHVAAEAARAKIALSLIHDFLLATSHIIYPDNEEAYLEGIKTLLHDLKKSKKLNLRRALQILQQTPLLKLKDLKFAGQLIAAGIYPTPTLLKKIRSLKSEDNVAFYLSQIPARMNAIRETEEIDPNSEVERELFFNHLGIPISFKEFEKVLLERASKAVIAPYPPHFVPLRVTAHGVEAMTHNINPELVDSLRKEIQNCGTLDAARAFLASLQSAPKTTLPSESKDDLFVDLSLNMADLMSKKKPQQKLPPAEKTTFSESNLLGRTEKLLLEEPSAKKLSGLKQAVYLLREFVKKTEAEIKEQALKENELNIFKKNIIRANELAKACYQAVFTDLHAVALELQKSQPDGVDLDELTDFTAWINQIVKDGKVKDKGGYNLFMQSVNSLVLAGHGDDREMIIANLKISLQHLFLSALERDEAWKKLYAGLQILTLLESQSTMEDSYSPKAEVALESAYDLYKEKIPEKFDSAVLGDPDDKDNLLNLRLNDLIEDLLYRPGVAEAREIMRKIKSSLDGVSAVLKKGKSDPKIAAAYEKISTSLHAKFDEIEKYYDHPPVTNRNYTPENTKHIASSLKYAVTRHVFEKIAAMDGIDEQDKKIIESLVPRFSAFLQQTETIYSCQSAIYSRQMKYAPEHSIGFYLTTVNSLAAGVDKEIKSLETYGAYQKELKKLEDERDAVKEDEKNRIHKAYLAECGGRFDNAEYHRRTLQATKKIEQHYGQKLRQLRSDFEKNNRELLNRISLLEKFAASLQSLAGKMAGLEKLNKEKLGPVETEMAKISYSDLAPDEFELVPSKKTGDLFKGWVSDDCSRSEHYANQISNTDFVNYRIYKNEQGERKWVGNVYVLNGHYNGQPALIFDAIQLTRAENVNVKEFLKQIMEAFGKLAADSNYRYIICNHIESKEVGYLVSNRTQIREAYMNMFKNSPRIAPPQDEEVKIYDSTGSFQCFNQKHGGFRILWEHPEMQAAVEVDRLKDFIHLNVGLKYAQVISSLAKEQSFNFRLLFQTEKAWEKIRALAETPEELKAWIDISAELIKLRGSVKLLLDPAKYLTIKKFYLSHHSFLNDVVFHLINERPETVNFLDRLYGMLEAGPGSEIFVAELLQRINIPDLAEIDLLFNLYRRLSRFKLQKHLLSGHERISQNRIARLNSFADYLEKNNPDETELELVGQIIYSRILVDAENLGPLLAMLMKFHALNPSHNLIDEKITTGVIISKFQSIPPPDVNLYLKLAEYLEAQKENLNEDLVLSRKIVTMDLVSSPDQLAGLFSLFHTLSKIQPDSEEKKKLCITSSELLSYLKKDPSRFPIMEELLKNLDRINNENVTVMCQHFLKKEQLTKAFFIAKAPPEELMEWFFYLSNLDEQYLEEADNLEVLKLKFLRLKYDLTPLNKIPNIRNLAICGRDYILGTEEANSALGSHFDPLHLSGLERTQKGETENLQKKKIDDVEIPVGYKNIEDFIDDQKSIYDLELHQ